MHDSLRQLRNQRQTHSRESQPLLRRRWQRGSQRSETDRHTAVARRRSTDWHNTDEAYQQEGLTGSFVGLDATEDRSTIRQLRSDLHRRLQNDIRTSQARMLHPANYVNSENRRKRPPHQWHRNPNRWNDSHQTSTGTRSLTGADHRHKKRLVTLWIIVCAI